MDIEVDELAEQEDGSVVVVLNLEGMTADVQFAESMQGSGDWRTVGYSVNVTAHDGHLRVSTIRDMPIGKIIATALEALRSKGSRITPLLSPSDIIPVAFLEDRRGKEGRTEQDYAGLALAIGAAGEGRRVDLPRRWAARYGGAARTWGNHISQAHKRGLLDSDGEPTERAYLLYYGKSREELGYDDSLIDAELRDRDRADGKFTADELKRWAASGTHPDTVVRGARQRLSKP